MFDSRPTICPVCGGNVIYGKMKDFGLTPYQSGYCYICENVVLMLEHTENHQRTPLEYLHVVIQENYGVFVMKNLINITILLQGKIERITGYQRNLI